MVRSETFLSRFEGRLTAPVQVHERLELEGGLLRHCVG
jgi:hypothetical protein